MCVYVCVSALAADHLQHLLGERETERLKEREKERKRDEVVLWRTRKLV